MILFVKLEEIPTTLSNITYFITLIILKYYTDYKDEFKKQQQKNKTKEKYSTQG